LFKHWCACLSAAVYLLHEKREIRQYVQAARADGILTPVERREIKQHQKKESRKIF